MNELFHKIEHGMEDIHKRFRAEFERLGLSLAAAARTMGDADAQGLRDACNGRKRVSADLLAKAVPLGVDAMYVLTGQRMQPVESRLTPEERALLDNYNNSDEEARKSARLVLNALSQRKAA